MTHAVNFGLKVGGVLGVLAKVVRNTFGNLDAGGAHGLDLGRVIGHQAHRGEAKVVKDRGGGAVLAPVHGEAQVRIRVDGVAALVLQRVGLDLAQNADSAALVSP